jgi:hypothetical protein
MKKISIIILLLACKTLFGQELTLKDLNVEEFYSIEEAEDNIIKNSINNIETFSNEDINSDFSNIKDLTFLKNISKEKKIVMLGETHYSKNISSLRNRIFFALNSFDYYPLIIIENSYSITEYSNYYIHIKDENEAKYFLENELSNFMYTDDELVFLNQLRSWNNKSEKQLSIGGSELEFSYSNVLEKILKPYFYKLKNVDKTQIDKIIELGKNQKNEFFIEIIPYLEQSKAENIIGNYSFINQQYISNIITNFNSTNNAFRYSFEYYRQKSILRNLTDDSFFGKILKEKKVMLHGGGEHMKSHFIYPENANFFSEGSYLNNDYKLTKNKTYSIMLECLAYSYGEMKNRKLKDCITQGNQYNSMVKTFQKGFEKGIINEQKPYFLYENRNEILKFYSQYYYKNQSISINNENWEQIKKLDFGNDNLTKEFIETKNDNFKDYDKYIIIPASEIVIAKIKKTFTNN